VPWLLVSGRIGAALFLIWMIVKSPPGRAVFNTALLLVLAGALGNLYDNLFRARDLAKDAEHAFRDFGPVRDFIDVYFRVWDWHFPTFNVADSCITVGAVLLFACALFDGKKQAPSGA
jgi:signal peptidase II